jgi:hypothetical protein
MSGICDAPSRARVDRAVSWLRCRTLLRLSLAWLSFALLLLSSSPKVDAQQILVAIDQRAPAESLKVLENYLPSAMTNDDFVAYFTEVAGIRIFRIQSARTCFGEKCLTILIRGCSERLCPHVQLLAEPRVYASDYFLDFLGGARLITFGTPGSVGTSVLVGNGFMVTTNSP